MARGENPYQGNGGGHYDTDIRFDAPGASTGEDGSRPSPGFTLDATDPAGPQSSGGAAAGDIIVETTTARFSADVIEASRRQPVLVDFWAPWCGPCKQLTPILEKVVTEAGGAVRLVKMNIDEHPAIAGQLGIKSIPAVIVFRDGQPVDGFMGAVPESQVRDLVKKLSDEKGGDEIQQALDAAAQASGEGDMQRAGQIYAAILQRVPDHAEAIGALADIMYESGKTDEAKELLAQVPEDKAETPSVAAVRAKMALADQVADLGDAAELEARLAADPKDHQARYDLALVRNGEGRREEAADHLLAIVRADRTWHDDAARQKLLELFEAWGPMEEATLSARRRLSSLLFS